VKVAALRLALVAATITAAGCSGSAPLSCELAETDPPPELDCGEAVRAADEQLRGIIGVTALRFEYEECAPGAGACAFLFGTAGNVIAELADGREIAVFVSVDPTGAVRADAARPYTPTLRPSEPGG
jgi:hypothetical protein